MSGNREGALKGALTNKQKHGEDFYKKIGSKSWTNPNRSRKTGFALLPKEKHLEVSKKGGQKTKEDYKTKTNIQQETGSSTGVSE
jgi:general stress protein YciG